MGPVAMIERMSRARAGDPFISTSGSRSACAAEWLCASHAMAIPDADLDEFISRWEHAFGERLTRAEAQWQASRLIALYKLLAKPLPEPPPGDPSDRPEAS